MAPKIIHNHSDDESSSDDDQQQQPNPQRSDPPNGSESEESDSEQSNPIPQKPPLSESDSGSDSDESDKPLNYPSPSDFKIKPISSKPMSTISPKKPASKSAKRPADKDQNAASNKKSKVSDDNKKKRNNSGGGGGDAKKSGINRLWSDEDELVMLKGLTDYKKEKGTDPYSDMSAFHEFIKGMLSVEVTKSQLTEKIRRVKKKFLNNAGKGLNGADPVFSRPHDYKSFQLSKKIWGGVGGGGGEGGDEDTSKKVGNKKKDAKFVDCAKDKEKEKEKDNEKEKDREKEKEDREKEKEKEKGKGKGKDKDKDKVKVKVKEILMKEEVVKKEELLMFPRLREALEAEASMWITKPRDLKAFVEERICLYGEDEARKMEKKWEEYRVMELELFAMKLELMHKQTDMVVAEMKKLKS